MKYLRLVKCSKTSPVFNKIILSLRILLHLFTKIKKYIYNIRINGKISDRRKTNNYL